MSEAFEERRRKLVKALKIKSPEIKKAFLAVPREHFFPNQAIKLAYSDDAFPIGFGQTISQPSTIQAMLEMLDVKEGQKVLEVGSGSGYVLALLAELVGNTGTVLGIEVEAELEKQAGKRLAALGYKVESKVGDGTLGWEEKSPFDRILVSAGTHRVPEKLLGQLKEGGKIVLPLGGRFSQHLALIQKQGGKLVKTENRCCYVFVPLKAEYSFH
jgi:protein-L-isoaspartate(D-aspartate) O-methyltransferase